MLNLEISISHDFLGEILSVIRKGDDRPTHYSVDEEGNRLPVPILNEWTSLVAPKGCFLWGQETVFDIRVSSERVVTVFVESENVSIIRNLAVNFSNLPLFFGYACDSKEREHRNKISKKMEYGVHEAWVGRDYKRYLPGIYWITIIPTNLMSRFGISAEYFNEIAFSIDVVSDINYFIYLYEDPKFWAEKSGLIDSWCSSTKNCFSKKLAEDDFAEAHNFLDAAAVIEKWK